MAPITVNETTGLVVGGHQRLAALDALEGKPDYNLDVAVVSLTPDEERKQNILLNNPAVQGDWDTDALSKLLANEVDFEDAGFEVMDLEVMLDDDQLLDVLGRESLDEALGADDDDDAIEQQAEAAKVAREKAAERKAQQKEFFAERDLRDDPEFYCVVVCRDRAQREELMVAMGYEEGEKFADGGRLLARLAEA